MSSRILAATLVTVASFASAHAADLNKSAKAVVDYVKICDAYGSGFFYIPGSDSCLKIAGFTRLEIETGNTTRNSDVGVYFNNVPAGGSVRGQELLMFHSRADVKFDARTNTEFGLLRSYIDFHTDVSSSQSNSARTSVAVDSAYVQLGGLTAGRAQSNYNFLYNTNIDNEFEAFTDVHVNQLAYKFDLHNGVTATIAVEDPTTAGYQSSGSSYSPDRLNGATFTYGALNIPDVVGNVNVSQSWGSAQLSAGLHQNYGAASTPYTKMGYGVQAGVNFNVPALGAGDTFGVQAAYSVGAINYAYTWGYTSYGSLSSGDLGADVAVNRGVLKQAKEWTIGAALAHHLTPTLEFDLTPSYYSYSNSNTAGALAFNAFELGAQFDWTPVKGLDVIPDFEYRNLTTSAGTRSSGNAQFGNASSFVFNLRIQRGF